METSDAAMERRDIAEGLRDLKGECVPLSYVLDELGVDCDGADVPKGHVERLADLIDRPTCHNVDHADEYGFVCSRCGSYAAGAFGTPYDEYRRRIAEASVSLGLDPYEVERAVGPHGTRVPWFCPMCGAEVVHDA